MNIFAKFWAWIVGLFIKPKKEQPSSCLAYEKGILVIDEIHHVTPERSEYMKAIAGMERSKRTAEQLKQIACETPEERAARLLVENSTYGKPVVDEQFNKRVPKPNKPNFPAYQKNKPDSMVPKTKSTHSSDDDDYYERRRKENEESANRIDSMPFFLADVTDTPTHNTDPISYGGGSFGGGGAGSSYDSGKHDHTEPSSIDRSDVSDNNHSSNNDNNDTSSSDGDSGGDD